MTAKPFPIYQVHGIVICLRKKKSFFFLFYYPFSQYLFRTVTCSSDSHATNYSLAYLLTKPLVASKNIRLGVRVFTKIICGRCLFQFIHKIRISIADRTCIRLLTNEMIVFIRCGGSQLVILMCVCLICFVNTYCRHRRLIVYVPFC